MSAADRNDLRTLATVVFAVPWTGPVVRISGSRRSEHTRDCPWEAQAPAAGTQDHLRGVALRETPAHARGVAFHEIPAHARGVAFREIPAQAGSVAFRDIRTHAGGVPDGSRGSNESASETPGGRAPRRAHPDRDARGRNSTAWNASGVDRSGPALDDIALDGFCAAVPGSPTMLEVTQVLTAVGRGEAGAAEELLPLVYQELRRVAAARLAHERPGQTLQATALVHEAWLRIVSAEPQPWDGRSHFFAAAAEAMRRILVENARRKRRLKHGGHLARVDLGEVQLAGPLPDDQLLALDEALTRLAASHPDAAQMVQLCFFAGLTQAEAAKHLGVSVATAERTWAFARAWLFKEVRKELNPPV